MTTTTISTPPSRRFWGPGATVLFAVLTLAVAVLSAVPIALADTEWTFVGSAIATFVAMAGCSLIWIRLRKGASFADYVGWKGVDARTLMKWVAGLFGFIVVADVLFYTLGLETVQDVSDIMPGLGGELSPYALFAIAVVFAPIGEEILFRGFMLRGFLGEQPGRMRTSIAVIASALIFAALHYNYLLPGMALLFGLGVIFALARIRTNSLVTPIVLHMVLNATMVSLVYVLM